MAISYTLYIATELSPQQAVGLLAARFDDKVVDDRFCSRREVFISAASSSPGIITESFGFTPTLSVGFRRPNEVGIARAFDESMLRATMWLLEHARDAVLLFNHEIIVLQRLGGKLAFNNDHWRWEDEEWVKQVVGVPYERRSLPSPLL